MQDLKGKILLKGKKIGGLEGNLSGVVEDSLGAEVSDEDEPVDMEQENHHNDSIRRKTK
ncbi:1-phosphatidylinositol 4,5-bisphosphate phosphodiesterase delta-4, partial [Tachysurus ichikawai]